MTQPAPNPAAFYLTGGEVGILLIHGFTGSASEFALLGPYLHERGLTVAVPLLPGHGTTPADLNRKRRQDWVDHAEHALLDLQTDCRVVFVAGLSMGALLAFELAIRHPELAGVIAYGPATAVTDPRANFVAFLKYLTATLAKPVDLWHDPTAADRFSGYPVYPTAAAHEFLKLMRTTRRKLQQVTCPLLIIDTAGDTVTTAGIGQTTYDEVGSTEKELLTLQRSGHILTLDAEWERVAAVTWHFVEMHCPAHLPAKAQSRNSVTTFVAA
ncbi:MAG TPA: alpha/beta fold hydrolase [Caldilineaceae bacterium]|nr:alpha/beta fold hydrolase [Caldilineaceae bacterium]